MTSNITDAVRSKYAAVAESKLSNQHQGVRAVAEAFGYRPEELASIPAEANMGVSCGNPTALASLTPGEVVVDLGSGGGLDVFLAAQKVGPTGKAIGIDMTPAMIERAKKAAEQGVGGKHYANVEFHLASIDRMPLADTSVNCVISNCVINLAPDKPAVFREIARVLKPGGRLAASDIALKKALPAELASNVAAYVGCIAGAIAIDDYRHQLLAAGFAHVEVIDSGKDLNACAKMENQSACCSPAMPPDSPPDAPPDAPPDSLPDSCADSSAKLPTAASCCCGSKPPTKTEGELHGRIIDLLRRYDINEFAASVRVFAVKPNK
jgi:SAM-dependent methyltransferase